MFVGMDVHKETTDMSVAEDGRHGEIRQGRERQRGIGAPWPAADGRFPIRPPR